MIVKTCKRCAFARDNGGEMCEKHRGADEAARYKGMRFTVERDGARITIDPKFDVPARAGARKARHAIRGEGLDSGIVRDVYPWVKLIDGVPTIIEASEIIDLSAPGDEMVRLWVRERSKVIMRRLARTFRAPMWRALRFARRFKGALDCERGTIARALRALVTEASISLGEAARRCLSGIDGRARRDAYARGVGRTVERLDKLARRWAGEERATLHGRYATVALCKEIRAFDAGTSLRPEGIADLRAEVSRDGVSGIASDIVARIVGDDADGGAMVALTACASVRKARGSRARNARAARALAVSEAKRIEAQRAGRASLLTPLGKMTMPELDATLAGVVAERANQMARLGRRSKVEREAGERGVIARLNAQIKAIEGEREARRADVERESARKEKARWARLRAWRIARKARQNPGRVENTARPCVMPPAPGYAPGLIPRDLIAFALENRPKFIDDVPEHVTMTIASPEIGAPVRVKARGFKARGFKVSIKGIVWTQRLRAIMRRSVARGAARVSEGVKMQSLALRLARIRAKGSALMSRMIGAMPS